MKLSFKNIFMLFLQGTLVGAGAILPGVSGGVLCAAFGIYEPMMAFLADPVRSFSKYWKILLPVLLGSAVGFVFLAKLVESLLAFSEIAAMSLFCGLIIGTVPEMVRNCTGNGEKKSWSGFALALILSFVVFTVLDKGLEGNILPNFGWYVFCGAIWGLSMVVPGLSSSSVLLFMGLYAPMTKGIGSLDFMVLLPMAIGFVLVIVLAAKGVNYLLKNHRIMFLRVILGFVISSVLVIVPVPEKFDISILYSILAFGVGLAISLYMGRSKRN